MPRLLKLLIGFSAAMLAGWLSHGPFGLGQSFVDRLDASLQPLVAELGVEGVTAQMQRDPLARTALLAGPADQFQREGLGSFPGIDERVLAIPGMARVEWANPPP